MNRLPAFLVVGLRNIALGMIRQVRDINRRYRTPHIKTTPMVKVCLLILRGYLLLLVAILVYKFISVVR
jgi:hypothetical protein